MNLSATPRTNEVEARVPGEDRAFNLLLLALLGREVVDRSLLMHLISTFTRGAIVCVIPVLAPESHDDFGEDDCSGISLLFKIHRLMHRHSFRFKFVQHISVI